MDPDTLPYFIEVYKGTAAKGDIEKKLTDCVVWALNSGNALRKVQQYYPAAQHNYIVNSARKLGVEVADLTQLEKESINFK